MVSNKTLLIICAVAGLCIAVNALGANPMFILNPDAGVEHKVFSMINDDRHLHSVPSAQLNSDLTNAARQYSNEMANSIYARSKAIDNKPYDQVDAFIVPISQWTERYYFSPQTVFDKWTNTDMTFRSDSLNRDYNLVGVGVSNDSVNYYVVIMWG